MAEIRYLLSSPSRSATRDSQDAWGYPAPEATIWRLIGLNNRELGRSAQAYVDPPSCRAGIGFLRRQLDHLDQRVWCDGGRWQWRLELNARPVATSGRGYARRREAEFNLAQFLAAAPQARIPGAPRPLPVRPEPAAQSAPVAASLTNEAAG